MNEQIMRDLDLNWIGHRDNGSLSVENLNGDILE